MLVAQGSGSTLGLFGLILAGLFFCVGIFFLVVGCFFPGMAVKELDQAKIKANAAAAVTGG